MQPSHVTRTGLPSVRRLPRFVLRHLHRPSRRSIGVGGLLVWVAGCVAAAAVSWGVASEPAWIASADGTPIAGTVYRPRGPAGGPRPAAVVIHGMAMASQSSMPGFAAPLARQGILTLALDLPGHGRSGGSLPRSWFADPAVTVSTRAPHPEVDAAVDYLCRQPDGPEHGDSTTGVVLVGHSLGGWIAADAATRRDDVRAVVSIGAAPRVCDATRPRNLLFVTGGLDQICPLSDGLEALAQARGGVDLAPQEAFGRLADGTDRRLYYVGRVNHFSEIADPKVTRNTLQWVAASLGRGPGPESAVLILLLYAALPAVALGGSLATAALVGWAAGGPVPATPGAPRTGRLTLVGLLVVAAVPLAAWPAESLEVWPVYFAAPAILLMTLTGCACRLAAAGLPSGTAVRLTTGRRVASGFALGALALVLAFGWVGVPWAVTWAGLVPSTPRLLLIMVLWPLLLPGCLGVSTGLKQLLQPGNGTRRVLCIAGAAWLGVAAGLAAGHVLVATWWRPLFAVPVGWLALSFLPALPLWLVPHRPGLSLARAFCHAGAAAWLLGCHLPFVHDG